MRYSPHALFRRKWDYRLPLAISAARCGSCAHAARGDGSPPAIGFSGSCGHEGLEGRMPVQPHCICDAYQPAQGIA